MTLSALTAVTLVLATFGTVIQAISAAQHLIEEYPAEIEAVDRRLALPGTAILALARRIVLGFRAPALQPEPEATSALVSTSPGALRRVWAEILGWLALMIAAMIALFAQIAGLLDSLLVPNPGTGFLALGLTATLVLMVLWSVRLLVSGSGVKPTAPSGTSSSGQSQTESPGVEQTR